jgi:rfaE bifunctional protein kinase chain/domain
MVEWWSDGMTRARFRELAAHYDSLRIAVLGDFCLDRYLEIDPARQETSLETGLPVHNVIAVRAQPGGAGTIVANLSALGIGAIYPIGFAGDDAEGFELGRALERLPGVLLGHFIRTAQRHTFTYCKPLVGGPNQPPVELNRLDFKNWTPTPGLLQGLLMNRLADAANSVDAIAVLDQVTVPETGVVTPKVLEGLKELVEADPELPVLADSRRGLRGFPPVILKMNIAELSVLIGAEVELSIDAAQEAAATLARERRRPVFVTLAENGMIGATPGKPAEHVQALPLRGKIDVVGAGDAVTANLVAALAAGAALGESLDIANAAASVVIHKLGTAGTANVAEIEEILCHE